MTLNQATSTPTPNTQDVYEAILAHQNAIVTRAAPDKATSFEIEGGWIQLAWVGDIAGNEPGQSESFHVITSLSELTEFLDACQRRRDSQTYTLDRLENSAEERIIDLEETRADKATKVEDIQWALNSLQRARKDGASGWISDASENLSSLLPVE